MRSRRFSIRAMKSSSSSRSTIRTRQARRSPAPRRDLSHFKPPDWSFDPDVLRAAFTPKTRLLLLNTPHNPTGKVFTLPELTLIAELAQEHDVLVITDEVYDRILFDGASTSRWRRCRECGSGR